MNLDDKLRQAAHRPCNVIEFRIPVSDIANENESDGIDGENVFIFSNVNVKLNDLCDWRRFSTQKENEKIETLNWTVRLFTFRKWKWKMCHGSKVFLAMAKMFESNFTFKWMKSKRTNDKHSKVFCRRPRIARAYGKRTDMASRIVHENDKQQRLTAASETVKLKHQMLHCWHITSATTVLDSGCLPFGHHHLNQTPSSGPCKWYYFTVMQNIQMKSTLVLAGSSHILSSSSFQRILLSFSTLNKCHVVAKVQHAKEKSLNSSVCLPFCFLLFIHSFILPSFWPEDYFIWHFIGAFSRISAKKIIIIIKHLRLKNWMQTSIIAFADVFSCRTKNTVHFVCK